MSRFGITAEAKARLLERLGAISARPPQTRGGAPQATPPGSHSASRPRLGDPKLHDELALMQQAGEALGLTNPYFRVHAGTATDTTMVADRTLLSFASYNYLGLNGDPRVNQAAQDAIARYGTSVSASRVVSGERPVHGQLETALAGIYAAEACIAMVSGHATNVTVIGHLVGEGDVVLHDQRAHNSIIQGAVLSGAERVSVPHNDPQALDRALRQAAPRARRLLVVIEGHYSMDGDIPDLGAIIETTRRHGAWLMVDEAHSLGVLGRQGLGVAEECGVDPRGVDIWMGTLSKTLAGCGGYIAASHDIVEYLRASAPGFVYSVGMSPPLAAAALEALAIMRAEPDRISRLRHNAMLFRDACQRLGLDTGASIGAAIVPVMIGSSLKAAQVADALFQCGINVQPILYPAVPERSARLRFFMTSSHSTDQIDHAAHATAEVMASHA